MYERSFLIHTFAFPCMRLHTQHNYFLFDGRTHTHTKRQQQIGVKGSISYSAGYEGYVRFIVLNFIEYIYTARV